jgi:hypothetical protein
MDRMTPGDRGGVVLAHPDRPIPSRRHLVLGTVPADAVFLVAGLSMAWWATGRDGSRWFVLGWVGAFALSWLVLMLGRIQRPEARELSQRPTVHTARRRALRTGKLPESPSLRIGAAARSCDELEVAVLVLAVGATTGIGALMWPALPWPMLVTGWAVLATLYLVGAVRGWAYLRLYEIGPRRPSS